MNHTLTWYKATLAGLVVYVTQRQNGLGITIWTALWQAAVPGFVRPLWRMLSVLPENAAVQGLQINWSAPVSPEQQDEANDAFALLTAEAPEAIADAAYDAWHVLHANGVEVSHRDLMLYFLTYGGAWADRIGDRAPGWFAAMARNKGVAALRLSVTHQLRLTGGVTTNLGRATLARARLDVRAARRGAA